MTLHAKITAMTLALAFLGVASGGTVLHFLVFGHFEELERTRADEDAQRCVEALTRELEHLTTLNQDWAHWDAAYGFASDLNRDFSAEMLSRATLENAAVNGIYFLSAEGALLAGASWDFSREKPLSFPDMGLKGLRPAHPLLLHPERDIPVRGFLRGDEAPLLVSAWSILTSERQGPPRGRLVFARQVDQALLKQLRAQTRVDFELTELASVSPTYRASLLSEIQGAPSHRLIRVESEEQIVGYTILDDLHGRPTFLIRSLTPRHITMVGRAVRYTGMAWWAIASLVIVLLTQLAFRHWVISPLLLLTQHAMDVGDSLDMSRRLGMGRNDEIGALGKAFDKMISLLSDAQSRLADTARTVGMAEMARGMLHNVGNALNNATVALSSVQEKVNQSRVSGLCRAAELMEEHQAELVTFITRDPRGRRLPEYLIQLSANLRTEQRTIQEELTRVSESVQHAVDIVRLQGSLSHTGTVVENVTVSQLIGTALSVVRAGYQRHGVRVTQSIEKDVALRIDRTKVVQILINLLTNAKEAMGERRYEEREVSIHATVEGGMLVLGVRDNGIGIAAEDLDRVFRGGFTTKPQGRGIGLHHSALSAGEMRGRLSVESPGLGLGATFSLELPLVEEGSAESISDRRTGRTAGPSSEGAAGRQGPDTAPNGVESP